MPQENFTIADPFPAHPRISEFLIKHGWPEDIWFHVDNLSSAHVYLRLPRGTPARKTYRETNNLDHLPDALHECVQLVKNHSIAGCKQNKVDVVYTPWENLLKGGNMDVGAVSYHDMKRVVKVRNVTKDREAIKRIEKTERVDDAYDYEGARAARDKEVTRARKQLALKRRNEEKEARKEMDARNYERDYERIFEETREEENVVATKDLSSARAFEDDFM